MGMSSKEWSRYMHDELGLDEPPEEISREVVRRMLEALHGASAAHRGRGRRGEANGQGIHSRRRLVGQSGADRPCARGGRDWRRCSRPRSPPRRSRMASRRPTSTAKRRGASVSKPDRSAAVEDSHAGIASARAAGMHVVAVPNPSYPPGDDALAAAGRRARLDRRAHRRGGRGPGRLTCLRCGLPHRKHTRTGALLLRNRHRR